MKELLYRNARWNEEGDYGRQFYIVIIPPEVDFTDEEIRQIIEEEYDWHCNCEHDCCGHVRSRVGHIKRLRNNRYAFILHLTRNI